MSSAVHIWRITRPPAVQQYTTRRPEEIPMDRTALVVGATGIGGYNTAQALLAGGWRVIGLSRAPRYVIPGVEHVYANVLDPTSVRAALAGKDVSHLFFTTWSRQDTEAENCRVNGAMLANTLDALRNTS